MTLPRLVTNRKTAKKQRGGRTPAAVLVEMLAKADSMVNVIVIHESKKDGSIMIDCSGMSNVDAFWAISASYEKIKSDVFKKE